MKVSKEVLLFSITLIVFLAGCARPTAVSANGVIITSFKADLPTVDPGTTATFVLNIKNVGEKLAEEVRVQFFGLSDKWTADTATGKVKIDGTVTDLGGEKTLGTLAPADPTTGLPGEERSVIIESNAPSLASDITYDANVRVGYKYITEGNALVRVVDSTYLRTNPNVQRGVVSSDHTAGPLVINFFARTPIVSPASNKVRVQVEIQNVGGGRAFDPITTSLANLAGNLDKVKIAEFKVGDVACPDTGIVRTLVGGKSLVISCDSAPITTKTFTDITFIIKLEYKYFVDSATQVTVLKALQ